MHRFAQYSLPACLAVAALAVCGCGTSDDLETYAISGTVLYADQPVPVGSVTLIPDSRQGNSGAAVSLPIVDGKFNSANAARGHVGGPHLVRITGFDGRGDDDLFPKGQMLFPDYELTLDLAPEETTQEFVVPRGASRPRR